MKDLIVRSPRGLARAKAQLAQLPVLASFLDGDSIGRMSAPASPPPRKRGCLIWGCVGAVVLCLGAALLIFLGYTFLNRTVNRFVANYTETQPAPLAEVELPESEQEALEERVKRFGEALESETGPAELVLTAEELNALIQESPDFKERVFVAIDDDRIKAEVSIPLEEIWPERLEGRYLNGTATLRVSLEGGVLVVMAEDLQVKGEPLPASIMREVEKVNFAQDLQNDPEFAKKMARFESITVKDDKVILRTKGKTSVDKSTL